MIDQLEEMQKQFASANAEIRRLKLCLDNNGDAYEAWSAMGQNIALREQLVAVIAALDEACDLAEHFALVAGHPEDPVAIAGLARVAECRKAGGAR